jgi:hypothetical protein
MYLDKKALYGLFVMMSSRHKVGRFQISLAKTSQLLIGEDTQKTPAGGLNYKTYHGRNLRIFLIS